MTENRYKSYRFVDGKTRWVIVDGTGDIINKNPIKEELKCLKDGPLKSDKKSLLNFLRKFYEENGRSPGMRDFVNNPKYPSYNNYVKHFGNWNNAISDAGLNVNYGGGDHYTTDELLLHLRKFYEENGRSPKTEDFINNPKYPCINTYQRRFGSWNNALNAADLCVCCHKNSTDEELLGYLIGFFDDTELIPTEIYFKNNTDYPHFSTYKRRFGSWQNALRQVRMDTDSLIRKGILCNTMQKGRFAEIIVRDHFDGTSIDLSGKNRNSPCDGICPNGKSYDVKSSKLIIVSQKNKFFAFSTKNRCKDKIEIYYFLAFNEDYTELMYAWRIPGWVIIDINVFIVNLNPDSGSEFNIKNIKEYDITDKIKDLNI